MTFHQPSVWLLLLLLLLPLVGWRARRLARRRGLAFSSLAPIERAGRTWAVRMRWIVPALRGAALVLLVVAIARPQRADEHTRTFTEGIAIELIVDRSGSMLAEDFTLDGRRASRLDVVKRVVESFVAGDGEDLPGRPDDIIGLVSFATFADSVCPLTLDHDHLVETIRETAISDDEKDRDTALGDAIALGVERMRGLARRADLANTRIKSHIMVLLTDGESNVGDIDPLVAADLAATYDIRIYTIGAGTTGYAPFPSVDPFTGRQIMRRQPVSIDEETLRAIAARTGGSYFRATDTASLADVYARIDELERTQIEQRRYMEYQELALEPVRFGRFRAPPLLAAVFCLLALEVLLASTRWRTLS